jgi:hypothetical protein
MNISRHWVLAFAGLGLLGGLTDQVAACATAYKRGEPVQVASESAIIVWDAGAKVEHFIRRAAFTTETPEFGFLVPTPTRPTLKESSDDAFRFLESLTAPEVVHVPRFELIPNIACKKKATSGKKVEVLERQRVAGYDATILRADSALALNDWLAKHEYIMRSDLTAWLEPYVKRGWIITAFKVVKDPSVDDVATSAVRMSFHAVRPFFPYSEPAEQRDSKTKGWSRRLLRVFFVAEARYKGRLGNNRNWPGRTVWAGPLQAEPAAELAKKLAVKAGRQAPWLTVFEDKASPRPGTADLFFDLSPDQAEIRRPPIEFVQTYTVGGWICLGVVVLLLGWTIIRNVRRSRPGPAV